MHKQIKHKQGSTGRQTEGQTERQLDGHVGAFIVTVGCQCQPGVKTAFLCRFLYTARRRTVRMRNA